MFNVLAEVVATPEAGDWKSAAILMGGMILMKLFAWISGWVNGKGAEIVHERLTELQSKINQNTVAGQIQADDAIINILQNTIPLVIAELTKDVTEAMKDGKITDEEWKEIASKLWEAAKPQIVGGANDYLENSSFSDGKVVAEMVFKRFFARQKVMQQGFKV